MFLRIKPNKAKQVMDDIAKQIPTAVAIGVNSTAKKARNEAAKAIRKELGSRVPLKVIKSAARATSVATKNKQTAVMTLAKGKPISLRYFSPSQTKKQGVTVRFNRNIKGLQGKTQIKNAFLSKRLGKKVFVRAGKDRLPIVEQFGPSPGDFIEALGLSKTTVVLVKKELPKRINRKIRDLFFMKKIGKN